MFLIIFGHFDHAVSRTDNAVKKLCPIPVIYIFTAHFTVPMRNDQTFPVDYHRISVFCDRNTLSKILDMIDDNIKRNDISRIIRAVLSFTGEGLTYRDNYGMCMCINIWRNDHYTAVTGCSHLVPVPCCGIISFGRNPACAVHIFAPDKTVQSREILIKIVKLPLGLAIDIFHDRILGFSVFEHKINRIRRNVEGGHCNRQIVFKLRGQVLDLVLTGFIDTLY